MEIKRLILGSKSPRRQELIQHLGYPVEIRVQEVDEIYPEDLNLREIPEYLAKRKAEPLSKDLQPGDVLLTSDTIVLLGNEVLGKPQNEEDAVRMLQKLSGQTHEVISGVALTTMEKQLTFSHTTQVTFRKLTEDEISTYVHEFQPLDKAGAYGIQEWIGYVGVTRISGSYLNVVGLPVADVVEALRNL